ncbi:hypothetical protein RI103_37445 (plasmid) [Paraburkholderia sp. FT54]|uniref:hypothetical protein n=1 Tax=Paraburkholderia sp. FT54 TaxID=3074437 RepID=UPI002877429C|nr:hypothetical protein [Paraburkholderia sp. FT54]WNC95547.1 hypothetical protein RI103_37445 [Paraburkholderia sp. FT54]
MSRGGPACYLDIDGFKSVNDALGMRGGILGSLAAWFGFTLPSAVFMVAFAYGYTQSAHEFDLHHRVS